MSYYVHRIHEGDNREGWVGPIPLSKQAEKEAAAWMNATDSFGHSPPGSCLPSLQGVPSMLMVT